MYSFHHELTLKTYRLSTTEYAASVANGSRCGSCWLRHYDCFCSYLLSRQQFYQHILPPSLRVTIYYHPKELMRSANTIHILSTLCPAISNTIVFGDVINESNLIEMILDEQDQNSRHTCILYPSPDSVLLPLWLRQSDTTPASDLSGSLLDERFSSKATFGIFGKLGFLTHLL
jgi:DTW domain-containing protein YfiP